MTAAFSYFGVLASVSLRTVIDLSSSSAALPLIVDDELFAILSVIAVDLSSANEALCDAFALAVIV